VRAELTGN
jgi:hypothetical protein